MQPKGKSTKTLQRAGEEGVSPGVGEGTLILPYKRRFGPFKGFKLNFISIVWAFQIHDFFLLGGGGGWWGMLKL